MPNPTVVSPEVTRLYNVEQPAKLRSVVIQQKTLPAVQLPFLDVRGDPVDLTAFNSGTYEVVLAVKESLASGDVAIPTSVGTIVTANPGVIQADVPADTMMHAGMHEAEFVIRAVADQSVRLSNRFWLILERSLFGDQSFKGPPLLGEVRLHLRDYPEGNRLLDEYEFDASEIAMATVRAVDWFNEVEPPLDTRFSTATFPNRFHWLEAIISGLFRNAAHYFRRNSMQYSAGGLQVSRIDKEREYLQAAEMHWQKWEDWARKTKVRVNADAGFTTQGSSYDGFYWYR